MAFYHVSMLVNSSKLAVDAMSFAEVLADVKGEGALLVDDENSWGVPTRETSTA